MKAYIDKSALVAELNRLIAELVEEGEDTMFEQGRISAFEDVKVFINHILEVKEANLEKELISWHKKHFKKEGTFEKYGGFYFANSSQLDLAKHFFELGLKAKGEQDMKAKIIKTGEIVDVYHEPQHGQITNIYKESVFVNGRMWQENELEFIDSLQEESTSNDLEEAVNAYIGYAPEVDECSSVYGERQAFKAGAQWQKEQMITKACNYLFSHMGLFVTFINDDIVEDIESCEFIKKFRIAMEDNYETSGHK